MVWVRVSGRVALVVIDSLGWVRVGGTAWSCPVASVGVINTWPKVWCCKAGGWMSMGDAVDSIT